MKERYIEKIGNILKNKREEKGCSIEEVANILKINPEYIKGLENFNKDIFPSPFFFKGFLKNYVKFLGLDDREILALYDELMGRKEIVVESSGEVKESSKKQVKLVRMIPLKYLVVFILVALIVFSWLRVSYINYKKKSEIEKRIATNFNTMTTSKELALHEEKKRIINLAQKEDLIKIKANDECWVEVRYDNNKIFQGLLIAGDEKEFAYKKGMVFKLGNAAAIEMHIKGELRKDLGKKGEVKDIVIE